MQFDTSKLIYIPNAERKVYPDGSLRFVRFAKPDTDKPKLTLSDTSLQLLTQATATLTITLPPPRALDFVIIISRTSNNNYTLVFTNNQTTTIQTAKSISELNEKLTPLTTPTTLP